MDEKETVVLGIDPGTRVTGYGILKSTAGKIELVDFGAIRPPAKSSLSEKYLILHEAVEALILAHKPQALSVETQYVHKNVSSAMKLGMARGAVVLAATKNKVPAYEYAPSKAKLAVTGIGSASKEQVQGMMRLLLGLKEIPEPQDAADALALALCHMNALRLKKILGERI